MKIKKVVNGVELLEGQMDISDIFTTMKPIETLKEQDVKEGCMLVEKFLLKPFDENKPAGWEGPHGLLYQFWSIIRQSNGTFTLVNMKNGFDIKEGFENIEALIKYFQTKPSEQNSGFLSRRDCTLKLFMRNHESELEHFEEDWNMNTDVLIRINGRK
jgi:hypothetical protein